MALLQEGHVVGGRAEEWRLIRAAAANPAASMSGSGTRARAASSCCHRPTASTNTASASRAYTVGMLSAFSWCAVELPQAAVLNGFPLSPNARSRAFPGKTPTRLIVLQSTPSSGQHHVPYRC